MQKSIKKIVFVLIMAALIVSCSKEDVHEPIGIEDISLKKLDDNSSGSLLYSKLGSRFSKTQARRIVAKAMAAAIAEYPRLTSMLVEEARKKFNGDTEILYVLFKDTETPKGKFSEILHRSYRKRYDQNLPDNFFNEEVPKADPYLTFYVNDIYLKHPELLNKPVTVAFQEAEENDNEVKFYEGYDHKGKKVQVTGYTENQVLIGIKANERILLVNKKDLITINGNFIYDILHFRDPCDQLADAIVDVFIEALISGEDYLVVELEELWNLYQCICLGDCDDPDSDGDGVPDNEDDCPDEAGPVSNNGCPEEPGCVPPAGCDRTNRNDKDEIYKFKFTSCAAYSSTGGVFEGKREMRAMVTYAYLDGAGNPQTLNILKASSFSKDALRDANFWGTCQSTNWVNTYWETITWDYCLYGENAHVQMYEEDDPDNTGSLSIGFTFKLGPLTVPVNATIPFANANDVLGSSVVQYCDNANGSGYLYNTGSIQFYFRMEP